MRRATHRWISLGALSAGLLLLAASNIDLGAAAQQNPPRKRINTIIEDLEQGKTALGKVYQAGAPLGAGAEDWVFVEMEHGPYLIDKIRAAHEEIGSQRTADGRLPVTPVVRIPAYGDESPRWMVKQVLDSFGISVCFPQIDTADQALRAVRSMRYPPQKDSKYPTPAGIRGVGGMGGGKLWGPLPADEYFHRADLWPLNPEGELFAMIMVESVEGVKNINEILKVPGIGAIFVGPSDLGVSLGVGVPKAGQPVPEEEQKAFGTILSACKAQKVICGISANPWASQQQREQLIKDGWRVDSVGSDVFPTKTY